MSGTPGSFSDFVAFSIPTGIALLVGANLSGLINSFQTGVVSPAIGLIPGVGSQLNLLSITVKPATDEQPAVVIQYGMVIGSLINFLIVCIVAYLLVIVTYRAFRLNAARKLV